MIPRRLLPAACLAAASLLFFPASLFAQAIPTTEIDRTVEAARRAFEAPGIAVAIVKDGKVVHLKGYGVKKLGTQDAVTPETQFAIGSTTKAFTTAAMAMLVDEGKMQWDDPVRKHLPAFRLSDPAADSIVTMRDLVSHRTGLSRNDELWYEAGMDRAALVRAIGYVPLTKPIRAEYQYQNIMFLAAGEAVGSAAGTTWERFVAQRIFEPLGMTHSGFGPLNGAKDPELATPYEKRKNAVVEIPWRNISNISPAGAIVSTAGDLSKWLRMQMADGAFEEKRLVSAQQLHETHQPQMVVRETPDSRELNPDTNIAVYGLGWRMQDYRGMHLISHGGAIDGYRAQVAFLPKEGLGIVVLANLGQNNMPEALRYSLIDLMMRLPAKDWNGLYLSAAKQAETRQQDRRAEEAKKRIPGTKPTFPLATYAGRYESAGYGVARVEAAGDELALSWGKAKVRMEHWHNDVFRVKGEPWEDLQGALVQFTLSPQGELRGMVLLGQNFTRPAETKP